MSTKIVLLLFCIFSLNVIASPVPKPDSNSPRFRSEALINCDDSVLKERIIEAGIPYRCADETSSPNDDVNIVNDPNKSSAAATLCDEFSVFIADVGRCVPRALFDASSSTNEEIKEVFFDPSFSSLPESICEEGYVFIEEKGQCILDNEFLAVRIEDLRAAAFVDDARTLKVSQCGAGSVFVSEIGICLPVRPNPVIAQPAQQNTQTVAITVPPSKKCPPGTVYSPEIDHCLIVSKPVEAAPKPEALSLVKDAPQNKPILVESESPKVKKNKKCKAGFVYVSEIDLCMPHNDQPVLVPLMRSQETEKSAVTPVPDPFRLTLAPLTSDQVGRRKCAAGEVYVSEIDLCLTP